MNSSQKSYITVPLICLGLGTVMVAFPSFVETAFNYVLGTVFLLISLFFTIPYLRKKEYDKWYMLIPASIFGSVGLFFLIYPGMFMRLLWIFIGIALVFDSSVKLIGALELRKVSGNAWKINLVSSVITITLGSILIFTPSPQNIMVILCGIFLIANALFDFVSIINMYRYRKELSHDGNEPKEAKRKKPDNVVSEQDFDE